jgi:translation initiation factor IF-1
MPGVTARSATKNMSKSKRASAAKNARRVDAAVNNELDFCTYGRVSKTLGNKMFLVLDTSRREHLSHIRGKMARIGVNDIVLLNIRDYESRAGSDDAVYDIMAVFDTKKDINKLIKSKLIPTWLASTKSDGADDGTSLHDLFDYEGESESDSDDEDGPSKKDKKNHRKAGKNAIDEASDSDVDIDRI